MAGLRHLVTIFKKVNEDRVNEEGTVKLCPCLDPPALAKAVALKLIFVIVV